MSESRSLYGPDEDGTLEPSTPTETDLIRRRFVSVLKERMEEV